MMTYIPVHGKGALPTPKETRDGQFRLAATSPLTDWSTPFFVPVMFTQRDQDGSSSCTAQASGYYCEALNEIENGVKEQYSARYIYSQVHAPGGGAYIWKAMSIPLKGLASAVSIPDGDYSEATMTDSSLNVSADLDARADKYAVIPRSNIDQLAQVIRDYHGFVTGFNGFDAMFAPDGTVERWGKVDWGHAVYCDGYEIRNGVKCIRFKNSWSDQWGSKGWGYFPEAFVDSGYMFDLYTYAAIADLDPRYMIRDEVIAMYKFLRVKDYTENDIAYWTGKHWLEMLRQGAKDYANDLNSL